MRARWPRGLAALLLAASAGSLGALALLAGPAQAAPAALPCNVTLCPPTAKITAASSGPMSAKITVVWTAASGMTVDDQFNRPIISISWFPPANFQGPTPPSPDMTTATVTGACTGPGATLTCTYVWPDAVKSDGFVLNGMYQLSAAARACTVAPLGCSTPATVAQSLPASVPPAAPTGVKATPSADGSTVTVSWTPNPEPDVVGYQVFRDGTYTCEESATSPNPTSYSCVDTPPGNGQYSYTVVAHRYGAAYSTASLADEPGSPASTPTGPVTVTGASGNTSTTLAGTGALAPPGFTAVPTPNKAAKSAGTGSFGATPGTAAVTVTTEAGGGFAQTLPYGQRVSSPTTLDPAAISVPAAPHKNGSSVGTIAAVGAGLLIAVVALHGLWLRSEVHRSGILEPLEPEM